MKKITAILLTVVMLFSVIPFTASAAESEDVATMWLCAEKSDKTGIWHIFLYFENLTDDTITVGKYQLAPFDTVSVGCFGTEGTNGAGVYYNLESDLTHYGSLIAISSDLDESELESVSKKIKSFNWWDPIFNCYYFAARAWNAGADKNIPFLIFPGFAKFLIQSNGGHRNPFELFVDKPVYKQTQL